MMNKFENFIINYGYNKMDTQENYIGPRDDSFSDMIKNLLLSGKLKPEYTDLIIENGRDVYSQVFTHPSVDSNNNYEIYEILGDSTINSCMVWYFYRRFPQLNSPSGVKVIARLKINYVSKNIFYRFAESINFWKFISADANTRQTKMKPTLEDVFEAFFGSTQYLIDKYIRQGAGYSICYNIIANMMDAIDISLKYEDLFDAKTRLKETFDMFSKDGIGQLKYENEKIEQIQYVTVYRIVQSGPKRGKYPIGKGSASLKPDAEQRAAEDAIRNLAKMGYKKPIPEFYKTLN